MDACIRDAKAWLYDKDCSQSEQNWSSCDKVVMPAQANFHPVHQRLWEEHTDIDHHSWFRHCDRLWFIYGVTCGKFEPHLSKIGRIRDPLTITMCKCLIYTNIQAWLWQCDALWHIGLCVRDHFNRVQKSAAHVVMQIRRSDWWSISALLRHLHCLPVRKRIQFKILVVVHTALYKGLPFYLASLRHHHTPGVFT